RPPSPIIEYPALGAVVSSQLTSKDLALPGFIGIGGTAQRIGPGFLGSLYSPFTVQNAGQPPQNIKAPASLGKDEAEIKERMDRRKNLFDVVENSFGDSLLPGANEATKKEVNNAASRTRPSTARP